MALFKKQTDPFTDRARALQAEIAALENEIRQLNARVQAGAPTRIHSTAMPDGQQIQPASAAQRPIREPIFEPVEHRPVEAASVATAGANGKEQLGVGRTDLRGALRRFRQQFRGPAASNPKLVSYLAAGSIKGLRPLRYEKRVARNRFLALATLLLLLLWGIYAVFVRNY